MTKYWNVLSYKILKNELKKKGFYIIASEGFNWIPFKHNSNNRLIDFFDYAEKILKLNRILSLAPEFIICAKKIDKKS